MRNLMDNKKLRIASIIVVGLIVCMSIGYAAFSGVLRITGTGHVKGVRWSIHYVENSINVLSDTNDGLTNITGDNVIEPATINNDLNDISFELSINPNTKYEFTVDITNDGDYDGVVKTVLLTTTKGTEQPISTYANTYTDGSVTYTVTYEDGTPVLIGDELNTGETKTLKFNVQYIPVSGISSTEDVDWHFETSIEYTQSSGLAPGETVDVPYRITYIPNGGTMSVTSKYVNVGDPIGALPTPTMSGLSFQGWYSDEALTKRVDESFIPTSNMNLYAKFGGKYIVTIDAENDLETSVDKIYVSYGDSINTFPTIDYQGGFQLEGWYSDAEYNNRIDTTYHPTSDTTIYAKSMLLPTANTYYLLDGYKFKSIGVNNILLSNSNIGTNTWSVAASTAESFMPTYNSRLAALDEVSGKSNIVANGTSWWLSTAGGEGLHRYVVSDGNTSYCFASCGPYQSADTSQLGIRPVIDVTGVSFRSTGGSGADTDPYVIIKK